MPDPKSPKATEPKSQIEKFRDLARKIGADESDEPLNEALRKVAAQRVKVEKTKDKPK
jgi:hypothetical protein